MGFCYLADLLPGAAVTSLAYMFGGATGYLGAPAVEGPHLSTPYALLVMILYVPLLLGIAAVLIKRRDVIATTSRGIGARISPLARMR
jgi:hypothetical protein